MSLMHSMPNMAKVRRAGAVRTRAAFKAKATPIWRRNSRVWISLRRRRSSVEAPRQSVLSVVRGFEMAKPEDTLTLDTTKGKIVIEMRPDLAPGHVARIKELVKDSFYDGIVFHRVIDGFMAQTGCPHGTGTGGSGKKLKAEFNAEPHVRGTVSMA